MSLQCIYNVLGQETGICPQCDEMVERHIVKRHVVSATIDLVLMESHQASMINQVVH